MTTAATKREKLAIRLAAAMPSRMAGTNLEFGRASVAVAEVMGISKSPLRFAGNQPSGARLGRSRTGTRTIQMAELADSSNEAFDERLKIEGVSGLILESIASSGYDTLRKFMQATPAEITTKVPGVNYYDLADKILEQTRKKKG